jgi:amidase
VEPISGADLEEVTIADLGARMASGELTARTLAEAYLARIETIDADLCSVIEANPDALAIADAMDDERRGGRVRGPLHGVPVLVKDNLDTAGAMRTTAGSLALEGARPERDATVVERLQEAGAVLLGKTNLSEWANFRSTRSSSGWSARGGQTRNPYALDRNPCGSSSGSGAAVSANLCAAAVGTETDGSIVCPSSVNGTVGIKPTVGLVSRAGVVPISHTQDTPGPMARTVADAAALLAAMAGPDPLDAATSGARAPDPLAVLDPGRLRGARIGVARNLAGFHDRVDAVFGDALGTLRALGAELVDPVDVPHATELEEPELEVLLFEFKADLEAYLATLGGDAPRSLAELIAFNREHADAELAVFGQELFEKAVEKGPLTEPAYLEALATCGRLARAEGLDAALASHRLDAIVAPTGAPAWLTDHVNGDHYVGGNSTPAAVAGYPSVTVPMGLVSGLPVGISFIGPAWSEAELIGFAYAFERATEHRSTPRLLPTLSP